MGGVTISGKRVTQINISDDFLRGSLLPEIGNLTALTDFRIQTNRLTGQLPAELGNLTNLQHLWLTPGNLTGRIPPELGNLTNLQTLWISGNSLTGSIPPELGNLPSLRLLFIDNNNLTGSIPSELADIASGAIIRVCSNRLTGAVPTSLRSRLNQYPSNQGFDPIACQGTPPSDIYVDGEEQTSNHPLIPKLSGSDCTRFAGGVSVIISNQALIRDCQALVEVQNHWADVVDNRNLPSDHPLRTWGTGDTVLLSSWDGVTIGSQSAVSAGRITELLLSSKNIRGSVPPQLYKLTGLKRLDISNNYLIDELPAELGFLSRIRASGQFSPTGSLEYFSFCLNYLEDDIPAALTAPASRITFGALAEIYRVYFASGNRQIVCQRPGLPSISPVRHIGNHFATVLAGGAVVQSLISGLSIAEGDIFTWDASTSKWTQPSLLTCTQMNADSCERWSQTTLPAGTDIYYIDGYVDPRTLTSLNLNADQLARSEIIFNPPATFAVRTGKNIVVDASLYASDGTAMLTCGDASGIDAKITVTRSRCTFIVTAGADTGTAGFTSLITSPRGDTHSATFTITILPVLSLIHI